MRAKPATLALALAGATLSACSFAPPYAPPPPPVVAQYKEQGIWTRATPGDALPRAGWWTVFGDPVLDGLEQRVDAANPTLAGALANYQAAQAYLKIAGAAELPTLGASGSTSRNRQSNNRPLRGANQPDIYTANTLGAQLDYELDLWGRIRNTVAAEKAGAEAASADLASARLSLEAALADDYARLRGLDARAALLVQTAKDYDRIVVLTRRRHTDGLASKLDLDRAETELSTAKAQVSDVAGRRASYEHAMASLVGETASTFALAAAPQALATPNVPAGLPSVLLQRRPDVAAAERRMAAANAGIGAAKAAFFPAITLDAGGGFQNTGGPGLLTFPNSYWGIGPEAVLTLFDGGRRKGRLQLARAQFDEASAAYRGKVLQAFQEVEDSLAMENDLAAEAVDQTAAVRSAEEAEAIATRRFQRGLIDYLDLVTAQEAALQAEEAGFDLATRRSQASIHLIRAIGGGWTPSA